MKLTLTAFKEHTKYYDQNHREYESTMTYFYKYKSQKMKKDVGFRKTPNGEFFTATVKLNAKTNTEYVKLENGSILWADNRTQEVKKNTKQKTTSEQKSIVSTSVKKKESTTSKKKSSKKPYIPSVKAQTKPRKTYGSYDGNMSRILNDAFRSAQPPGWRKSADGKWYYEARINRADNTQPDGYIRFTDPETKKEVKVKDTPENRQKLMDKYGVKTKAGKAKKASVKSPKKTAKSPTVKKEKAPSIIRAPGTKRMKKGIRATKPTKRNSPKISAKADTIKKPFTIDSMYKDRVREVIIAHVKDLTGEKKNHVLISKLTPIRFKEAGYGNQSLEDFNAMWGKYAGDNYYNIVTKAKPEDIKKATASLGAYGWKKENKQLNYLKKLQKEISEQEKKDRDEMAKVRKRAEKKVAEQKALAYQLPSQKNQNVPEVSTVGVKINEGLARRAKESYNWSDYKSGSQTAAYNEEIREAAEKVNAHKKRVDPIYWDKIDSMFETYKRRLGAWIDKDNAITAKVPSWFIAGPANYPVRKHRKQMAQQEAHFNSYKENIEGYLQKILSVGNAGISSDDKQAVQKIGSKLELLERNQTLMKMANAYYRKHKTLEGSNLPDDIMQEALRHSSSMVNIDRVPFPAYVLQNNNANIRRLKEREQSLKKQQAAPAKGDEEYSWGTVVRNKEENRLQLLFNEKPSEEIRSLLKHNGFRWSPRFSAWQRMLNRESELTFERIKDKLE